MTAALLRFALRQRVVTLLVGLLLVGFGLWSFTQLSIEAYPDISDTQVVVITQLPGRAAEEVEEQVTVPVERALNGVPGVIARRSRTIFGLSVVELTFAFGTDDYLARQLVLERLRDAEVPEETSPTLGPLSTPIGELYRYTLVSPGRDPMELRELQDWVVAPRLMQVPGIADIVPFGGLVKQYQVEIDPLKLAEYGLAIGQVASTIDDNNSNAGGAMLDNRQQSLVVRGVGRIRTLDDLGRVLVTEAGGVPVFLRDVGQARIGASPQTGIFGLDETTGGIEGIVLMRRGENPSQVLEGVKEAFADLEERLPDDVHLSVIYDRADLVSNTLETVGHTLLEGLTIVIFVLFLFLRDVRAALLTAVTIPLSLLFAFGCMYLTGIPANLLSLGALDFGIIVDGAVVMVERIVRAFEHGGEHGNGSEDGDVVSTVRIAGLEVERPIFYSIAIIVSAYVPLFTLQRVERRLFTPMAFTVSYALVGALLVALTLIPVLSTYVLKPGTGGHKESFIDRLALRYRGLVAWAVQRARMVALAGALLVGGSLLVGARLGSEFLPALDEGVMWVRATLPPGTSLFESAKIAGHMRTLIGEFPEVAHVASQSGRNDSGTDPYGPNRTEMFVGLKPYSTWARGRTKADLVDDVSKKLHTEIPGAAFTFTQPIIDNVTEAVTGSAADLAVIISGPDLNQLRKLAAQTLDAVKATRGAADTAIEQEADQPQLVIRVDREKVARYGINVRDVQDVVELAIGGRSVSTLFEGERRFDIALRYPGAARSDPEAIGAILVPTREGGRVPLSQLADVKVEDGASIIARRENRRQITVRTNIHGTDQGSFVADAQQRVAAAVHLPAGYRIEWGGQFENLARARRRLTMILPVTIAIIFALLFSMFGSSVYAGLVLMNVPFSLVGGVLALAIRGINLSVSAAVGFISLFGVAVMSGVLMVAEINRRRREPGTCFADAIVDGAAAQLRPVMMMIVVALLGMMPAARATGIGSDVQRPLATVVVGGLLSTLLLTLFVLPSLYALLARPKAEETS